MGTRISCPATVSGVSAKVSVVITSLMGSTVNLNFTLGDGVLVVQKLATFTETKFGVQDLSCGGRLRYRQWWVRFTPAPAPLLVSRWT